MISTRDALLARILANPDCDLSRLVYCDCLDEDGDEDDREYAAYIRGEVAGQCAHLPPRERGEAERYTRRLDGNFTFRSGHAIVGGGAVVWWRRGFIDNVDAAADHWLRVGDAITQRHPVQTVRLTTRPPVQVLRAAPGRQWHCTLEVPTDGDVRRVSIVVSDRELELYRGGVDDLAAERLLRAHWPRVRTWTLPPQGVLTVPQRVIDPHTPLWVEAVDGLEVGHRIRFVNGRAELCPDGEAADGVVCGGYDGGRVRMFVFTSPLPTLAR